MIILVWSTIHSCFITCVLSAVVLGHSHFYVNKAERGRGLSNVYVSKSTLVNELSMREKKWKVCLVCRMWTTQKSKNELNHLVKPKQTFSWAYCSLRNSGYKWDFFPVIPKNFFHILNLSSWSIVVWLNSVSVH